MSRVNLDGLHSLDRRTYGNRREERSISPGVSGNAGALFTPVLHNFQSHTKMARAGKLPQYNTTGQVTVNQSMDINNLDAGNNGLNVRSDVRTIPVTEVSIDMENQLSTYSKDAPPILPNSNQNLNLKRN